MLYAVSLSLYIYCTIGHVRHVYRMMPLVCLQGMQLTKRDVSLER